MVTIEHVNSPMRLGRASMPMPIRFISLLSGNTLFHVLIYHREMALNIVYRKSAVARQY